MTFDAHPIPPHYNLFHPAYWFGDIDARPFALFRIAFGALMLKEALYHLPLAEAFYSDMGILPRHALTALGYEAFSLMNSLPAAWMAMAFFAVWAGVALALMLGWRTRLMSILNFVLLVSVMNRAPLIATGAEVAQCAFAFWSIFIPLGRCYSLDACRSQFAQSPMIYAFPARMMQMQLAIIYIFNAVIKMQGISWRNGDALFQALQAQLYTFPLGDWLLMNAPLEVLRGLTHLTLLIEGGFTLLVFAPILQPYLRAVGLLAGIGLHIGIGLAMNVPNFPAIMLLSYLMLLDPRWIDWGGKWLLKRGWQIGHRETPATPTIEKSGCSGLIGQIGRGAFAGAGRGVFALLLMGLMGAVLWGNIVDNDRIADSLGAPSMPPAVQNALISAGLWQAWGLFAPEPLSQDTEFMIVGTFADGRVLDLRTDQPPETSRARYFIGPWSRWNKFEENMGRADNTHPVLGSWLAYTCRSTSGLASVEIMLRTRPTVRPGQPFADYTSRRMAGRDCG